MVVPLRVLWGLLFSLCSLAAVAQTPTIGSFSPTSGPGGTTVTVTGTNLTNIKSVVLRGIPCNITAISSTQASFKVPAQASTGRFRLTTTGGNVLSASDFTVTRASNSLTYVLRTNSFNSINVSSASAPHFTDLDHDGLLDLLVGRETGELSHYEQSAANSTSFTLRSANLSGVSGHYFTVEAVTDVDGDGLLDMVLGSGGGNFKHYEQSAANGTSFSQLSNDFNNIYSTGGTTFQIPHFTDLDGDGLLDLLVGDEFLSRWEQTAANGGTFTQLANQNFAGTTDAGNGGAAACMVDLDGDGLLDLLVGRANGQILHHEQASANSTSFPVVTTTFNGISVGSYANPAITDLDGDGLLDLLVGASDGILRHYEQVGTPTITSFTPTSGVIGTSVTITGTNLDGATAARVNGTAGTIVGTPTSTSLTFTVGAGSTTGAVTVVTPGGTATGSTFTVTTPAPTITSFTPTSGPVGTSVTVTGTNLNGATAARVNGTGGTIVGTPTSTSLTFTVGAGSTTGAVSVVTPGGTATGSTFTVIQPPTITSFTPTSGPVGTSVTITGTNLTGATAARVNGTAGTIQGTPTATSVTFTVGAGSTTGAVSVTTPGGTATGSTFTVVPAPTITTFTPTSGLVGTSVTITGTNLNGATAARVNGTAGTIVGTPTATSVTFTVGAGSTTGAVSVTTPGGTATGSTFTVIQPPTITSFTPTSGPLGTSVTITGTNLTGATAAQVNGTTGSITSNTATSLTFTVGAGSTTGAVSVTTPGGTVTGNIFTVTVPAVTSVNAPTSNTYGVGDNLNFSVVFSQNVTVNTAGGTPSLPLTVGSTARTATYLSGSGSSTLVFRYTVLAGDLDTDGVTLGGSISLNGGTIRNTGGSNALLTLNGVASTAGVLVDGVAPTLTITSTAGPSGSTTGTSPLTVTFTFSEPVTTFLNSDISVSNGTKSSFTTVNSSTYTVNINPTGTPPVLVTINVAAGAARDLVSNSSLAATPYTFTYIPAPTITTFNPTSGPVGTSVVITGTNLTGATAVAVNGTAGTITANTATSLTFTVVAGSTTGAVSVTTSGGTATGSSFTVTRPPTALALSPQSVAENTGANAVVGTFSTTDPDVGNTFTYTLVTGAGSGDNALVNISGSTLRITAAPNFEAKASYAVRVRTTDNTSLFTEQAFTVTVTDVNEAPTGLALSPQNVDENTGANAVVGTLSTTDPDATNTFTYSLVTGAGSTDNGLVNISGNTLRITASPDFETKPSYAVRVRTTDQNGLFTEQAFTLTVNDLAEGPGLSSFTPTLGPEGTVVTLIGANFTGTTGVSFNGTPAASFTLVSATQLTATVPVGAASGLITVATNSGSDQTASAFEVLPIFAGTFNSCLSSTAITSTGSGQWQYLRASTGELVAALNDQGHALGTVSLDFYLHQGAVRSDTEGREYFDRNWKLTAQNTFTGQQVRVRLYARNAEFTAYQAANDADGSDVTSRSQLRLTQYSGANEDCLLGNNHWASADTRLLTPAAVEALSGANWFALETVIADHFSEFFLNGGTDPLPVELVRFAAARQDAHTVALTWATAAEKANRGFVVERSVDGRTFESISELVAGRGTASTYAWTDRHALAVSTTYYRLVQVDLDGTTTYSGAVAVRGTGGGTPLALAPNPARETLTIQPPTGATEVVILDALGRAVLTVPTPTEAGVSLRLPLPSGVYTVRAGRETTRLVVE